MKRRPSEMKIRWLGHSCFLITGKDKVLIDPYLSGNPAAPLKPSEVECDIICVTHGHSDHIGDAVEIAKRTKAPIVALFEVASYVGQWTESLGMNIGGSTRVKGTTIKMVQAVHSSGIPGSEFKHSGGSAAGFIIGNDKKVYHAGDTALFLDMKTIGEVDRPDVALLPIGDLYTMGPKDAAMAVSWINPHIAIPMHYNTWPKVQQDPNEFKRLVEGKTSTKVLVLKVGEEIDV
jgi:L-ascorbate metabolism protein UlaG (beta-lactamase superfamily)